MHEDREYGSPLTKELKSVENPAAEYFNKRKNTSSITKMITSLVKKGSQEWLDE
jgi:hypothetical protein